MITQNYIQHLSDEIDNVLNDLPDGVENVRKESKLKIISYDEQEAISDPFSIDHTPQNTNKAMMFMELLTDEAMLRDLDTMDKGMDELRDNLKEQLVNEQKVLNLVDRLRH